MSCLSSKLSPVSPVFIAPKSTKRPGSRLKKHSFYAQPPLSYTLPLPQRRLLPMKAAQTNSSLIKGFGGKMNRRDLPGMSLLPFLDDKAQADEKFQCQWAKEGNVAETENGMQLFSLCFQELNHMTKIYAVIVGASFCIVVAFFSLALSKQARLGHTVVPYSDLVGSIRDGSVIQVQFVENSRVIYYNTKPAAEQDVETFGQIGLQKAFEPKWKFCTRNVGDDKHQLIRMLKDQGITYGAEPELLTDSMKNFLFVMLQQGGPHWFTKRKPSKKQFVTFDDVEGVDSAKAELREIVLCINEDSKYMKLGAKVPRGVLLAGPPGTGKTLLARAVAGEAGVPFFSISASELVEVFAGTGAARVREIFREARKHSPSIIFIDEIDAVGETRGRTLNCERDQTLNQLLTEMDGFEKDANVVVIAATNRPETLDSALMRPGRFSRKVLVGKPDEDGRRKIFSFYLREVLMEEDKEAISSLVASLTPGLVGADLENIADESVLLAARRAPYWFMLGVQGFQLYHQLNLGKMTKRKPSKKQSVTFDDVEGVDSAKAELLEIVLCINEDSKYMKLGAKLPRGVLLAGPPGTGKTLLARAVAGEAGVSFFSISASELVEIFVGTGAARVRDIFREARKHSPSIIFIDEIDAVGGKRGRTLNCERDQTLNQLLTEMDGFEKDASVVVIAATNRPETLDSALMRPGRFSRKVLVGEPDEDGRQKIFSLYLREVPMEEDKEAISSLVASRTPGLVGADLENIAHESVLLAARRDGDFVTSDDVLQAVERATKKIYDDDNSSEPYSFGPMAQAPAQYGGGAMGFGFN
ncbi:hypothetical protein E3N88_02586 [Mikania micrantha]|uniref:AAA+ ATPase domain-containing protein n=1 Tax=Mikania micrantha TaxID=192012 RepID=A0A5N6Q6W7_9ASTR|nr:hypothetical protein E3N88_02586 [Mikania micrantha]